jgi:hypothetical protein
MRDRLPRRGGRYHFFSEEILQSGIIKHRIGQKPFQAGILVFKALQPLGLTDIDPAILGLPLIDGGIADAVLAAQIGDGNPASCSFRMPMI